MQPLSSSSLSPAPEINTGNIAPTETISEAYCELAQCRTNADIVVLTSNQPTLLFRYVSWPQMQHERI